MQHIIETMSQAPTAELHSRKVHIEIVFVLQNMLVYHVRRVACITIQTSSSSSLFRSRCCYNKPQVETCRQAWLHRQHPLKTGPDRSYSKPSKAVRLHQALIRSHPKAVLRMAEKERETHTSGRAVDCGLGLECRRGDAGGTWWLQRSPIWRFQPGARMQCD